MDVNALKIELAKRELCRRDLKTFLLDKWENYEKKRFNDNPHYDYVSKLLEASLRGEIPRLIINMPPSYGKTELIARTFIPWALGNDPTRKFMYVTYSDELYSKISNQIRDFMQSRRYQNVFSPPKFIQDNTKEWVLKEGGGLFSTTLKSPITGFHAHTVIVDDPIKAGDVSSKTERRRVIDNFRESVLSRLLEDEEKKATVIIMMQRLHEEDLCGYLLNPKNLGGKEPDWKVVSLKALNSEDEVLECGDFRWFRAANTPLFPTRHGMESLEKTRLEMGNDAFSTQYLQDPRVSEAGYFIPENFRTIASFDVPAQNVYVFVDAAESLNAGADNRAIVAVGFSLKEDETEEIIVHDCLYGIWDEEESCAQIIEMMTSYPQAPVFVEQAGGGITLMRLLHKQISSLNSKLRMEGKAQIINDVTGYVASRKISKVEKIKALRPHYNAGTLRFKASMRGLEQIRSELLAFNPEKPHKKDDCIDALASALISEFTFPLQSTPPAPKETPPDFEEASPWNV